jgi:hypothetical protein
LPWIDDEVAADAPHEHPWAASLRRVHAKVSPGVTLLPSAEEWMLDQLGERREEAAMMRAGAGLTLAHPPPSQTPFSPTLLTKHRRSAQKAGRRRCHPARSRRQCASSCRATLPSTPSRKAPKL